MPTDSGHSGTSLRAGTGVGRAKEHKSSFAKVHAQPERCDGPPRGRSIFGIQHIVRCESSPPLSLSALCAQPERSIENSSPCVCSHSHFCTHGHTDTSGLNTNIPGDKLRQPRSTVGRSNVPARGGSYLSSAGGRAKGHCSTGAGSTKTATYVATGRLLLHLGPVWLIARCSCAPGTRAPHGSIASLGVLQSNSTVACTAEKHLILSASICCARPHATCGLVLEFCASVCFCIRTSVCVS